MVWGSAIDRLRKIGGEQCRFRLEFGGMFLLVCGGWAPSAPVIVYNRAILLEALMEQQLISQCQPSIAVTHECHRTLQQTGSSSFILLARSPSLRH